MYYKLKKPWSLRGYPGDLLTLEADGEVMFPYRLTGGLYRLLESCDGKTDLTQLTEKENAVIEHYIGKGIIEASETPSPIAPWQEYRYIQNRRIPGAFFSITGRCNLKCLHCFDAADNQKTAYEFSLEEICYILDQLLECGIRSLVLSGGEPLVHRQFPEIIREIAKREMKIYRLYTNGVLFTSETASLLKGNGFCPEMVISFDGLGVHDWMRGRKGVQEAAIRAIKISREAGFSIRCALNMNKATIGVLSETSRYLYELGVRSLFFIRTSESPEWLRTGLGCLTPDEYWEQALNIIKELRDLNKKDLSINFFNGPNLKAGEVRQHHEQRELPKEKAFDVLSGWCFKSLNWVNISSTGRVMPCDGCEGAALESGCFNEGCNILETPLQTILTQSDYSSAFDVSIADIMRANPECNICKWKRRCCGGGCRVCGTLGKAALAGEGYFDNKSVFNPTLKGPLTCSFYRGGYYERLLELLDQ